MIFNFASKCGVVEEQHAIDWWTFLSQVPHQAFERAGEGHFHLPGLCLLLHPCHPPLLLPPFPSYHRSIWWGRNLPCQKGWSHHIRQAGSRKGYLLQCQGDWLRLLVTQGIWNGWVVFVCSVYLQLVPLLPTLFLLCFLSIIISCWYLCIIFTNNISTSMSMETNNHRCEEDSSFYQL